MMHWNRSLEFGKFCDKMNYRKVIVPLILAPVNIIGSALVLSAICASRELKKINTFQFIANMSISDIMVSVIGVPLLAILEFHSQLTITQAKAIENAVKALFDATRLVSAFTLISLSVDKVLACIFHLKYNNYFTATRSILLISAIWLVSLSVGAVNWAVKKETYPGYTCQPIKPTLDVAEAFIILVCFVVIFSSNLYLMLLSKSHQEQDRQQRREANSRARKIYEHYKSIKSLVLVICMFGIGLLSIVVYFLLQQLIGCTTLSCTAAWEYLIIIHYFDLQTKYIVYCFRFKSLYRSVLKISGLNRLRRVRVAPDEVSNQKQENGVVTIFNEKAQDGSTRKIGW